MIGEVREVSRVGTEQLSVEWRIPEFSSLSAGRSDMYESPYFGMDGERWYFVLWTNYTDKTLNPASGWVPLRLWRHGSGPSRTFRVSVGIRGPEGEEKRVEVEKEFLSCDWNEWDVFCRRSELTEHGSRLTPGDVLVITCVIVRVDPARGVSSRLSNRADSEIRQPTNRGQSSDKRDAFTQTDLQTEVPAEEMQPSEKRGEENLPKSEDSEVRRKLQGLEELQKSLQNMLKSGDDTDVIINVRGKEFPAHRGLLRSRSAVFNAMFSHDMVEKQSGVVTMEDCDPQMFPDFLEHVYTGSCEMISTKNVFSLYTAADKYDLSTLKRECTEFMKSNLNVSCFRDAILLAVKHGEKELIERATEFFCDNSLDILKTVEWEIFMKENTTVGNELLIKQITRFQSLLK